MKKLTSLVLVGYKDDHGVDNKVRFLQYHDDVSGANEYKVVYDNICKEVKVTKEQGNDLYRKIIKNAYCRLKVV